MITAADIRRRINPSATQELNDIEPLIAAVVDDFEGRTHRLWNRRVGHVLTLRPRDYEQRSGLLRSALAPIEIMRAEDGPDASTLAAVDADDYEVEYDTGLVRRISGCWDAVVRFTVTGGYTPNSIPASMREALVQQILFVRERYKADRAAVSFVQGEGGGARFVDDAVHAMYRDCVAALALRV